MLVLKTNLSDRSLLISTGNLLDPPMKTQASLPGYKSVFCTIEKSDISTDKYLGVKVRKSNISTVNIEELRLSYMVTFRGAHPHRAI